MKSHFLTPFCALLSCISSYTAEDILNFKNNDTLHGSFLGYNDNAQIKWSSPQSDEVILFKTDALRKIIFQKGNPCTPFTHSGLIELTNGDTLPCKVIEINDTQVTIQTDYLGRLKISKKHVHSCSINPLGKQIIYQGPISPDAWTLSLAASSAEDNSEELVDDEPKLAWEFGNFSWYSKNKPGSIILNEEQVSLPSSFRILFSSEANRNTNVSFLFNADFEKPDPKKNANQNSEAYKLTSQFGECFALHLHSGTSLGMYMLDENGQPNYTYLKPNSSKSNYYSSSSALVQHFEIRANFHKKVIALYNKSRLISQWSLRNIDRIPSGKGIGFYNYNSNNAGVSRISNIIIAPWNGVMDSALSLHSEESDIVLLNNGDDRFSGDIISFDESLLQLKGIYAEMHIPRKDIQSLHFSLPPLYSPGEQENEGAAFHLGKTGKLHAKTIGSTPNKIQLEHPILGKINLDFSYLTAITYDAEPSLLDAWNTQLKIN